MGGISLTRIMATTRNKFNVDKKKCWISYVINLSSKGYVVILMGDIPLCFISHNKANSLLRQ
jgi:hypothetical protein